LEDFLEDAAADRLWAIVISCNEAGISASSLTLMPFERHFDSRLTGLLTQAFNSNNGASAAIKAWRGA